METALNRALGRPPHVCFVAPAAWPILSSDRSIRVVGGAEVQQCILARALAKCGYRVSMICMNFGQPDRVVVDGIEVYRVHAPDEGAPIVRFIHPRLTTVWKAMKTVDADVYYQRTCGALTGFVAAFCRHHNRAFIYAAASNADFDLALPLIRYRRDKNIFRWGLRHAAGIVVQNSVQQTACRENFGRPGRIIASCYMPSPEACCDPAGYILWVSTMRRLKRPEIFLELAKALPQFIFRMVGGPDDPALFHQLQLRAHDLPNVDFEGFVPHAAIEEQFNGARVFVNTSEFEGFPNTFLQSWARGIPTVSFFDPGCTLSGASIVQLARSFDDMVELVAGLMTDDTTWCQAGARSRTYFAQCHSLDPVVADYGTLIDDVLSATD